MNELPSKKIDIRFLIIRFAWQPSLVICTACTKACVCQSLCVTGTSLYTGETSSTKLLQVSQAVRARTYRRSNISAALPIAY